MKALFLIAIPLAVVGRSASSDTPSVKLTGERWRVELRRDAGTFDVLAQPAGEAAFVSFLRPDGEKPWFGYNLADGKEARTCEVKPTVKTGGASGPVSVRCDLDREHAVTHEALYTTIPEGLVVVSRFTAGALAPEASIVRFAPKLDVNIDLLTHYAYMDGHGRRHQGALADLGERNTYAGVGAWEPGGDVAARLNAERPYMLLHNPQRAISLGVILPCYDSLWRDANTFLQLYKGGYNFWYTGFLPSTRLRGERVLVVYLKQSGSPDAIEEDAPRLCREVPRLISSGKIDAPSVKAMLAAQEAFEGEAQALHELILQQPPTRAAWVAMEMLRTAHECRERDPVKALDLVQRGKAELEGG
ncbi:MAG: hypothetical protein FJX75_10730 [Armatimonadetes bacterium]|nr:hypothetical protein [Armatimonadota bacterium]